MRLLQTGLLNFTKLIRMTLCHAASVVANYLSAVESDNFDDGNDEYSQFESEGVSEHEVEDVVMIVEQDKGVPVNKPTNEDKRCSTSGFVFSSQEGTKSKVWCNFAIEQKDGIVSC